MFNVKITANFNVFLLHLCPLFGANCLKEIIGSHETQLLGLSQNATLFNFFYPKSET